MVFSYLYVKSHKNETYFWQILAIWNHCVPSCWKIDRVNGIYPKDRKMQLCVREFVKEMIVGIAPIFHFHIELSQAENQRDLRGRTDSSKTSKKLCTTMQEQVGILNLRHGGGDGGGGAAHAAYHASSGRMKPEEPERCHSTAVFTAGKSRFKKLQFVLIKSDNV